MLLSKDVLLLIVELSVDGSWPRLAKVCATWCRWLLRYAACRASMYSFLREGGGCAGASSSPAVILLVPPSIRGVALAVEYLLRTSPTAIDATTYQREVPGLTDRQRAAYRKGGDDTTVPVLRLPTHVLLVVKTRSMRAWAEAYARVGITAGLAPETFTFPSHLADDRVGVWMTPPVTYRAWASYVWHPLHRCHFGRVVFAASFDFGSAVYHPPCDGSAVVLSPGLGDTLQKEAAMLRTVLPLLGILSFNEQGFVNMRQGAVEETRKYPIIRLRCHNNSSCWDPEIARWPIFFSRVEAELYNRAVYAALLATAIDPTQEIAYAFLHVLWAACSCNVALFHPEQLYAQHLDAFLACYPEPFREGTPDHFKEAVACLRCKCPGIDEKWVSSKARYLSQTVKKGGVRLWVCAADRTMLQLRAVLRNKDSSVRCEVLGSGGHHPPYPTVLLATYRSLREYCDTDVLSYVDNVTIVEPGLDWVGDMVFLRKHVVPSPGPHPGPIQAVYMKGSMESRLVLAGHPVDVTVMVPHVRPTCLHSLVECGDEDENEEEEGVLPRPRPPMRKRVNKKTKKVEEVRHHGAMVLRSLRQAPLELESSSTSSEDEKNEKRRKKVHHTRAHTRAMETASTDRPSSTESE